MTPQGAGGHISRTLPPGYIHLGVAKEIVPVLRDFGIDPDRVIREARLDSPLPRGILSEAMLIFTPPIAIH